ncbi:hypothetical protein BN128_3315 [Cronobacter sakazakii 696]|nr:hypothetical protein BN128_3315 [Cronobacter sakazakii 696]
MLKTRWASSIKGETETVYAVRQFVHGHRILVVLPEELGFGQTCRTRFHLAVEREFALNRAFAFRQLFQERRRDGQTVATRQLKDFADVTEACAHYHGFIAVLFVVLVDFRHRHHARIFLRRVFFLVGVRFVPVEDTAHKRGDQIHARFSTGTRLREGEQQRQVTVDAFFFQLLRRADALPGGSQFDQDAIVADAGVVVEFDQALGFGDAAFGVIGQTRVHFGRDTARDKLQDFQTDIHCQFVGGVHDLLRAVAALAFRPGHRIVNQFTVFRDLRSVKDQRRVSRGILRLVQLHCRDISSVSNHSGELTKGGQFIRHDSVSLLNYVSGNVTGLR